MISPSLSVLHGAAVVAEEARAGALLAAERQRCRRAGPATNHLKPTGTSSSRRPSPATTRSMMLLDTIVLPTPASALHVAARAAEQVRDRRREVVVRVQQARAARDDPVAIGVGVVGERDVEAVLERDQPRHRVGRGAVHADLAVVVERHERERRVDSVVDDLEVEPVAARDRLPVRDARAAERVDARAGARRPRSPRWRRPRPGRRRTPSGSRSRRARLIACS